MDVSHQTSSSRDPSASSTQTPTFDARALVGPQGKALLVLDTETYILKITRNNRLILTK